MNLLDNQLLQGQQKKKYNDEIDLEQQQLIPQYSEAPPPPFEENTAGGSGQNNDLTAVQPYADEPQLDQADNLPPPPEFSFYNAEQFRVGLNNIVSHDPHLNTDGEALYRFLLDKATKIPRCLLHCRGTHQETRTRWVSRRGSDGRNHSHAETHQETVVDFDFYIDISEQIYPYGKLWSVADSEPSYRGKMVREIDDEAGNRRDATKKEISDHKMWLETRNTAGYAPWTLQSSLWSEYRNQPHVMRSSKSLRQWADEYCASPKYLKEFMFEKVVHGWDFMSLEHSVRDIIARTGYPGEFEVKFSLDNNKIYVRPDNRLSRMLSNKWLKFLSIILFIFPFIWLFKRFHSRGGGRWEVGGAAFKLNSGHQPEQPMPAAAPPLVELASGDTSKRDAKVDVNADALQSQSQAGTSSTQDTPQQRYEYGSTANAWYSAWKPTIVLSVDGRLKTSRPLIYPRHNLSVGFNPRV